MNSALQVFHGFDTIGTMLDFFSDRKMIEKVDQRGYRHQFVDLRSQLFKQASIECDIDTPHFFTTPMIEKSIRETHGFKPLGPQAQFLFGQLKAWTETLK